MQQQFTEGPKISYRWRSSGFAAWNYVEGTMPGSLGEIASINHMPINRKIDDGGPFYLHKVTNTWQMASYTNQAKFDGQFTVGAPVSGTYVEVPTEPARSDADLFQLGGTAIARCEPTNPTASLSQTLGELRNEGLPATPGLEGIRALKERTKVAKSAGSEYLNVEFGWAPLVRDVRSFAKAAANSESIIDQYRKGSGVKMRKGYNFPTERSVTQYIGTMSPNPVKFPDFLTGMETVTKTSEVWFKGAFRYHVPMSDDQNNRLAEHASNARKLYGLDFDAEMLWNIAPWSWLEDWYMNTGDVMHNIAAFQTDSLVMQYGYIMSQRIKRRERWARHAASGGSVSHVYTEKYAQRKPGSPYGFGAVNGDLTDSQTAILVALGLSRT
nr:MAG: hypothetical protein 1 [Leviviridae sp.]